MGIPVKIKDVGEKTDDEGGVIQPNFFAFHGVRRRYPGDKFEIKSMEQFSPSYMTRLDQPNIDIPDDQYDPSDEVDIAKINQLDDIVDNQADQDPQQAGPTSKKKAANKKKKSSKKKRN